MDTLETQAAFAKNIGGIRFPLIADPEGEVAKAFEVYREDWKVSGRATAVISEDGLVLKTYPRAPLDGKGHAEEVFSDVEALVS